MANKFPNLFGEEVQPPESISYNEMAVTIQTLTNLAGACAIVGDIDMGKAFAQAVTPLIAETMKRWPTLNPAPDFEATKQAVEAASNSSTTTEGEHMKPEGNDTIPGDNNEQGQNTGGLDDRSGAIDTTQPTHNPNVPAGAGTDGFNPNGGDGSGIIRDTGTIDNSRDNPRGTATNEVTTEELNETAPVEEEQVRRNEEATENRSDRGPADSADVDEQQNGVKE